MSVRDRYERRTSYSNRAIVLGNRARSSFCSAIFDFFDFKWGLVTYRSGKCHFRPTSISQDSMSFFLVLSGVDFAEAVGWSFVLAGTRRLRVLIEIN